MPRGYSENLLKARRLTNAKIIVALSIEPLTYTQLHEKTNIQTRRLRDRLTELTFQNIIFEHTFKQKDPNIEYNAIYYLLNWNSTETRNLVEYWFASADPSLSDDEKIRRSEDADLILMLNNEQREFLKIDKNQLSETEYRERLSDFSKVKRILHTILILDCKVKPGSDYYSRILPYYDEAFNTIAIFMYVFRYDFKDTMIKLTADYERPFLLQYTALWTFITENREKFMMFAREYEREKLIKKNEISS